MFQKCVQKIYEDDSEDMGNKKRRNEDEMKLKAATNALLEKIFMVLKYIYKDNLKYLQDYR